MITTIFYIPVQFTKFIALPVRQSLFYCLLLLSFSLNTSNVTGQNHEEFSYTMKFNGKSTANSILKFSQTDSATVEITWLLKSKAVYKLFFPVDNVYQSFVNISTGLPEALYKNIKQKNITQSWRTVYNRDLLTAVTDNGMQWPIQNGCLDLLSLIWTVRNNNPAPGDSLCYLLDIESHLWRLTGRIVPAAAGHDTKPLKCDRQVEFTFTAAQPVIRRAWKTDLLTNRISRADTKLTLCFSAPPDNIPVCLKFVNSENTVEMLLDKIISSKTP